MPRKPPPSPEPQETYEQLLPNDVQAEAAVLGSILVREGALTEALPILQVIDFYRSAHRAIYQAALDLQAAGSAINFVTVAAELRNQGKLEEVGGTSFVSALGNSSNCPDADATAHYARIVQHLAFCRRVIMAATAMTGPALQRAPAAEVMAAITEHAATLQAEFASLGTSSPLRPLSLAEMRLRPKPEPLVDRMLIAGGTSIVFGPSGEGKTVYLVDGACHVALDKPWLGRAVKGGPVVYIAAEGGNGIIGRVDAWLKQHGDEYGVTDIPDLFVIPYAVQLLDEAQRTELIAHLVALPSGPPVWVIVETVSQTSGGADENSNSDMRDYLNALVAIREATGAHITCSHHTPKADEGVVRGASVLKNNPDTAIGVTRSGNISTVTCPKQRDGWERFKPFAFTADQIEPEGYNGLTFGVFRALDRQQAQEQAEAAKEDAPLRPKVQAILLALPYKPDTLGFSEWFRRSGVGSRDTFSKGIEVLLSRGLAERNDSGDYSRLSAGTPGTVQYSGGTAVPDLIGTVQYGVLDTPYCTVPIHQSPNGDLPPATPCPTCGGHLWAHLRNGTGWGCRKCERSEVR